MLHYEGWTDESIDVYLGVARSIVYRTMRRLQENPELGAFEMQATLEQVGIDLSVRTVSRGARGSNATNWESGARRRGPRSA